MAVAKPAPPELPVFSERLSTVLEAIFAGQAPNAGRFCGHCYTPIDKHRMHCPHCRRAVADYPAVTRVPSEVLAMFRQLRRRDSLVVNGFAYLGLLLGVLLFIGVFYAIFTLGASIWWYIFDIALLFVALRVLAGLLGGFVGDEAGFRYARRRLAEEWRAYEAARERRRERTKA